MKKNNRLVTFRYIPSSIITEEIFDGGGGSTNINDKPENYYLKTNSFYTSKNGEKSAFNVNLQTGKLYAFQHLFSVGGNRLPANMYLTYNQSYANNLQIFESESGKTDGALWFKGWKLNYQQYLRESDGKYYFYDENFELHVFEKSENNTSVYFDKSGKSRLTLTKNSDNTAVIDDGMGTKRHFNTRGELIKISAHKGSGVIELLITYDESNRIATITDGIGRVFSFNYEESGKIKLEFDSEILVTLDYLTVNHLDSITYEGENASVLFERDTFDRLLTVNNAAERSSTTIGYSENGEVVQFAKEYNDTESILTNSVTLAYGTYKSTVTETAYLEEINSVQQLTHYYFAENGELIYSVKESVSADGQAQTISEKAIEFMAHANSRFDDAEDFKGYETVLTASPFVTNTVNTSGITWDIPKVSEKALRCIFSAKIPESATATAVLKENGQAIATLNFSAGEKIIQNAFFDMPSGAHNYSVEFTSQGEQPAEASLFIYNGRDVKKVISTEGATFDIIQTMASGQRTWKEVNEICTITNQDGNSLSRVNFTFEDYVNTFKSYLQNNSSFNVWYYDGEGLLTNCNENTTFCFDGTSLNLSILDFYYGLMQKTTQDEIFYYLQKNANCVRINNYVNRSDSLAYTYSDLDEYLRTVLEKNIDGGKFTYNYDIYGNVTQKKLFYDADTSKRIVEDYTYLNGNYLATVKTYKEFDTFTTTYAYDKYGNVTSVTLPSGQVINYGYNSALKLASVSATCENNLHKNNLTYALNNLSECDANSGNTFGFGYNKFNELAYAERGNNQIFSLNTNYDANGSGYTEIDYVNGYIERRYFDEYGHVNKISSVTSAGESVMYEFIYGDIASLSDTPTISANSKLLKVIDKRNESEYNNGEGYEAFICNYNAAGILESIEENKLNGCSYKTEITAKDVLNRVTQKHNSFCIQNILARGIINNVTYKSLFSNEVTSDWCKITANSNEKTINSSYSKDSYGRPSSVTVKDNSNNGHIVEYTYYDVTKLVPTAGGGIGGIQPMGLIPSGTTTQVIGSTPLVSAVKTYRVENNVETLESTKAVEYDADGNITKYGDNTYVYDGLGRLIRENNKDLNKTYLYAYDTRGNLLSKTPYNYTTSGTLTANGTAQTFTYDNDDKIIGYTYDSAGNITSYNNKTLTWQGKELKQVNCNNGLTQLNYDALGNRHSKITEEYNTYYYYDGANLSNQFVYDKYGDEKCVISFLYNQQGVTGFYIIESIGNNYGGLYTFRKNIFGDITDIYQGTTRVAKYKYDAWGNCTVCNSDGTPNTSSTFIGNINPFRYRGYYWDKELGLYYLHSRYYDPAICRFISLDSIEYLEPRSINGLNLYAYCGNDPINRYDPSGHFWDCIFDAVFIAWGIYDLFNGGYKDWKNWVALGVDIVFAVLPFVPSGVGQVIKVGNKIDNAVDVASAINKIDNIQDMSKVTMIGRSMDRVTDTATLIGKADNLYDAWKGYDATATGFKKIAHDAISMLHNAGWMFGKLRSGYTVIDIGMTTLHRGRGLNYGAERFVIGLWKTRNLWKLPINYYF